MGPDLPKNRARWSFQWNLYAHRSICWIYFLDSDKVVLKTSRDLAKSGMRLSPRMLVSCFTSSWVSTICTLDACRLELCFLNKYFETPLEPQLLILVRSIYVKFAFPQAMLSSLAICQIVCHKAEIVSDWTHWAALQGICSMELSYKSGCVSSTHRWVS